MRITAAVAIVLLAGPAFGQDGVLPGDLGGEATKALEELRGAAKERILLADMIGVRVTGPSGETLGTVRDLAAIPGGRIVAVVMEVPDGGRVAVPYQLVTVSQTADTLGVSLPVGVEPLLKNAAVNEMSSLLGL
jgi:hypothetical protein